MPQPVQFPTPPEKPLIEAIELSRTLPDLRYALAAALRDLYRRCAACPSRCRAIRPPRE